jgi:hypothetical protein
MRRRRGTIVTIAGQPRQLTAAHALRFEVVRGVLFGTLTLEQGAARMRSTVEEVARLVEGARLAVQRALGDEALDELDATAAAHATW